MRRAQITLFIILGIIVLSVFGVSYYLLNYLGEDQHTAIVEEILDVPADVMPVKTYVDECVSKVAEDGIYYLSLQGG